jgi:hypothetical protein
MRKFLRLSCSVALACALLSTYAQPVITAANFNSRAAFTDSIYGAVPSSAFPASLGANQTWDYSSVVSTGLSTYPNYDATDSTAYPNAYSFTRDDLYVFGAPVETYRFDALDNSGRYTSSLYIKEFILPLGGVTGGASDQIKVLRQRSIYTGRMDYIQFPVQATSNWTGTKTYNNQFELTVAAYNLTQTPGALKASETQQREVVGYGSLILPDENGSPMPAVNALLIEVTRTVVDSIFLGGAPAPTALLNAFGLVQGSVRVNTFYVFYAPGFHQPLATYSFDAGGNMELFAWRPDGMRKAHAHIGIGEHHLAQAHLYPNPVKAGTVVNVELPPALAAQTLSLYNLTGEEVHTEPFVMEKPGRAGLHTPSGTPVGIYLLKVIDESGKTLAYQKVLVQ